MAFWVFILWVRKPTLQFKHILIKYSEITGEKGDMTMGDLSTYEQEALLQKLRVKWIYNSNAIEGNTLSEGDTSFIIKNGLTVQGKSLLEHQEVIGHVKALDLIYAMLEKDTLREEELFQLHKAIQTAMLVDSERPNGAYKVMPNGRWITIEGKDTHCYYPHPDDTKHLMHLWFKEYGDINTPITSKEEAIKRYTQMHIGFTAIHPFYDGNGRLARLIANIPLLKNNYLPIIIDSKHRATYIELLSTYNLQALALNSHTTKLIETNPSYLNLIDFFTDEYKNSEEILDALRESTRALEENRNNRNK